MEKLHLTKFVGEYYVDVKINGNIIKRFDLISDDFAMTHAREYYNKIRKLSDEEFKEKFPEYFL